MITKITGKAFKGLDFEQPIGAKTIFLGNNGSGKSARVQALTLALLGYVPGSAKTNAEILENFGYSDLLSVGFELNRILFQRAWQKVPAGSVKELFQIQGKRCTKEFYLQSLGEQGIPKILDLSTFLDLSDQKKIDMLLGLYPSDTDLAGLEEMIQTQKKNILLLEDKARSTEKAASALISSRAIMQLPAGSLAETTANIEKAEKDLETANKELNEIITANAAEKAKIEAEEKAEIDKQRAQEKADAEKKKAEIAAELSKIAAVNAAKKETEIKTSEAIRKAEEQAKEEFKNFLQSVLDTMDATGCTVCAAKMVIKKEMKKYARN
jgi:DNA repair exonuclease SbcCD ATPase subunit